MAAYLSGRGYPEQQRIHVPRKPVILALTDELTEWAEAHFFIGFKNYE
jgi:hypothetical protein